LIEIYLYFLRRSNKKRETKTDEVKTKIIKKIEVVKVSKIAEKVFFGEMATQEEISNKKIGI
jgi:hypothetical protein